MTLYTETQKAAAREYASHPQSPPLWLGIVLMLVGGSCAAFVVCGVRLLWGVFQ